MMRNRFFLSITITGLLFFMVVSTSWAQNPSDGSINKCGIHLNQPEEPDIIDAARLCNSNGGDWGRVALVLQERDRDIGRINEFFNLFRKHHLVPIIRIATGACGSSWCKPEVEDAKLWADFLCDSDLIWPTDQKHIVLFNEPNQGKEWGGEADPEDYADVAYAFSKALKQKCDGAHIKLAGFDAAAPQKPPRFMDEAVFLKRMIAHKPELFDHIDGWASHSYANPGFVGKPNGSGRNSVGNYEWELSYLRRLGVDKDMCVYITESGWPHAEGISYDRRYLTAETTSRYYSIYFNRILDDERVCAVTPFIINDQSELFDHFSWKMFESDEFYPQYDAVRAKKKVSWSPRQKQRVSITSELPGNLTTSSSYTTAVKLTNGGVAWWDATAGYKIGLTGGDVGFIAAPINDMQPNVTKPVGITLKTNDTPGEFCAKVGLFRGEELVIDLLEWCFTTVLRPSVEFRVGRLVKTSGVDFTLDIYDASDRLVYRAENVEAKRGHGIIPDIGNIVIGEQYRVVLNKPYHLPVEERVVFREGINAIRFSAMAPVDFDNDGEFSLQDLVSIRERLGE